MAIIYRLVIMKPWAGRDLSEPPLLIRFTHAAMEQVLLDYIKTEFEEHGGNVTLTPPLGFTGEPTPYQTTFFGYGNCY